MSRDILPEILNSSLDTGMKELLCLRQLAVISTSGWFEAMRKNDGSTANVELNEHDLPRDNRQGSSRRTGSVGSQARVRCNSPSTFSLGQTVHGIDTGPCGQGGLFYLEWSETARGSLEYLQPGPRHLVYGPRVPEGLDSSI